ncbi:MAG: hypothetical protein KGI70_03325 [Patescibacteria group bacterium]|nr:hypothetical protein [Patescibacteria group bacterium]
MHSVLKNLFPRKIDVEFLILAAVMVCVGVGAFGLGRLSVEPDASPAIVHEPAHNFAASKSGSVYYPAGCSAANIQAGNEVWFATEADAQAAGYTKAARCN